MKIAAKIFLLAFLLGCSMARQQSGGFTTQSGNLTFFILDTAAEYGGHPVANGFEVVQSEWRYKADKNGIQIYLSGNHITEIQSILTHAFGAPDSSRGSSPLAPGAAPGRESGWYSREQTGVSIHFFGDANETGVSIMRGRK